MNKAGKVWGETACIFTNHATEMHRIEVRQGSCCSEHAHAHKWNGFYVERGELLVKVWQPSGTMDETRLGPGDCIAVPPGVFHQFVGLTDVLAFELYWHGPLVEDIHRRSVGSRG